MTSKKQTEKPEADSFAEREIRLKAFQALKKRENKERLTRDEIRDISRYEKLKEETQRRKFYEDGIPQKDLIDGVPSLTRATLANWEAEGLPVITQGKNKFYPVFQYIAFLHSRFVKVGRKGLGDKDAEEYSKWETKEKQFKAQMREMDFRKKAGEVVEKSQMESLMVALASEVKAALLVLPTEISAQLAGLPANEIRKVLDKHVRWKLGEFAKGRLPLPEKLSSELEKLLKKYLKGNL